VVLLGDALTLRIRMLAVVQMCLRSNIACAQRGLALAVERRHYCAFSTVVSDSPASRTELKLSKSQEPASQR